MTGASIDQAIWVTKGGVTTTITLGNLYREFVLGRLPLYRIYYVDPQSIEDSREDKIVKPLVGTMSITDVINQGTHQQCTVTSEDGLTVTLGATGYLLDFTDFDPPHVTVSNPPNAKHYVTALKSLGGPPGDKVFVRRVTGYYMTGSCNVITVPTPNMIASSGFVVMS